MAELSFFVGVLGNIISLLLFLAPVEPMVRIVQRGSTEEFESIPYTSALLCASLWTYYGLTKPGVLLVATVNGFGVFAELIYVSLFFIYAASPTIRRRTSMEFLGFNVGFFGLVVLVTSLILHGDHKINLLGLVCAGVNIVMYASPLSALRTVLTEKSVKFMPFWLSLFVFLNSAVWSLYAFLLKDIFLAVPNAAGVILGAVQLIVYAIYWRPRQDPAQQPLIV